ncbi:nucleoside hydrolase [[Brevibacterium] frigoritolerans]|uniref:Nucleoside hydrolase n=1 Tax=Peribacillus frigoritolerans TaxID=450367 RepID=A0A941J7J8_9BACI|nr:nucleoside hydrolase [Peribacillus frigoritolerans]
MPETKHAVDSILEIIENNPGEIEIVTIGPVTNIALAILKAPETMKKVKRIYSMGTAGFGPGNTTPVAEFNVYVDAEAYSIMMKSEFLLVLLALIFA